MALRTVGVRLQAEVAGYMAGLRQARGTTKDFVAGLNDAAKAGDATAKATALAGEVMERSARGVTRELGDVADAATAMGQRAVAAFSLSEEAAEHLDRQIEETAREVQRLEAEFRKTGDLRLFDKLGKELGTLKKQLQVKELFGPRWSTDVAEVGFDAGSKMGPQVASGLAASATRLGGPLGAAGIAIGAPMAVGLVSMLGAAVGGAVVGGAGIGGVAGGLMLAARDARVQTAGAALAADLGEMFGRSSAAFVPETLGAIEQIRREALRLEPDLRRVFAAAARFVDPLTRGVTGMVRSALPGFIRAIERAEPVIDATAEGLVEIGDAAGDVFDGLADHADEGAQALRYLFLIISEGIRTVGVAVEALSWLFDVLDKGGIILNKDVTRLGELTGATDKAGKSSTAFADLLAKLGNTAGEAADKTAELADAIREMNDAQLGANAAERAFQAAIDDAREAFDKKVRSLDPGTERGRKYSAALDEIARTARRSAQAVFDTTYSQEAANAKLAEGRAALIRQAEHYGLTRDAAVAYADAVLSIPPKWTTTVTAQTAQAMRDVQAMKAAIAALRNRNITIGVYWKSNGDLKVPGGTLVKNRWGGVYEHAQVGVLREAQIASPMGPARYAWAEPATGGEAFIPKNGDPLRSMAILEKAASWYGATVMPQQPRYVPGVAFSGGTAPMAVGGTVLVRFDFSGVGDDMARAIRKTVRVEGGGSVQVAFGTGSGG